MNLRFVALCVALGFAHVAPSFAEEAEKPLGTVCFSSNIRNTEQRNFSCKDLGSFQSVNDLYKAGYRVVTSSVINEAGMQVLVFFVEKR